MIQRDSGVLAGSLALGRSGQGRKKLSSSDSLLWRLEGGAEEV